MESFEDQAGDEGPFFITFSNRQPFFSYNLAVRKDGVVRFVPSSNNTRNTVDHQSYKKSENQLWAIRTENNSTRIISRKTQGYLKAHFVDGIFKELQCAPFEEQNSELFNWQIDIGNSRKLFSIQSSKTDLNGKRVSLFQQATIKQKLTQGQAKTAILVLKPIKEQILATVYNHELGQNVSRMIKTAGNIQESFKRFVQQVTKKRPPAQIPELNGGCIDQTHEYYRAFADQYATTSYPIQQTSPSLICFPTNEEDIIAILKSAALNNKKVTTRSGGHQYSGKSSGGQDTIQIDLGSTPYFRSVSLQGQNLIRVQPGIPLQEVNKWLTSHGFSIPHGQCPLVCIGGHGQTGGYGNFLRSFGLNGDYIEGFTLVTADGNVYNLVRPNSTLLTMPSIISKQLNDKLFTGVLTGNAGSFGVITNYIYKYVRDTDHPNSYGYHGGRLLNLEIARKMLLWYEKWSKLANTVQGQKALRGQDFFFTLGSAPLPNWITTRPSMMLLELAYSDLDNLPYQNQFKDIISDYQIGLDPFLNELFSNFIGNFNGPTPISTIARASVKRWPLTRLNGRQFNLPYKKRVNVTVQPLKPQFIDGYINIISQIIKTPGIKFVSQMQAGGGQYTEKGKEMKNNGYVTYPHRSFVFAFTYDIFYTKNHENTANIFQQKMQDLIDAHFNNGKDQRVFWGSFGDTDMTNPQVVNYYYDDLNDYTRLQDLKAQVDPKDLFSTSFTVKLPNTGKKTTTTTNP